MVKQSSSTINKSQNNTSAKKWILMLLCTVQFMSLLDTSIVQVAIPSIQQSIHLPIQLSHWLLTVYAVLCGGFMLLGGRLGDLWGRRRMLIYGMALFTAASAWAGLAGSGVELILARAGQGIGAALMIPSVLSLITLVFAEGHERNRALGLLGSISAVGFTSGLIVGGLLTDTLGWRFIFFINIPIGLLVILLAPRLLPESNKVNQPLDSFGALTITGSLLTFLYALTAADSYGWFSFLTIGLLLISMCLFVLFIIIEKRVEFPLVPLSIFAERSFVGAIIASLMFGAIMGSSIYFVNLYLQHVLEYRPLKAAFAFLPQELLTVIAASLVGRLVGKVGVQNMLAGGMLVYALGLSLLSLITAESGYVSLVLPGTLFIGLGAAMVLVSGSIAVTLGIRADQQGLASGLWNTGPQIGTSLGIAILMAVASTRTRLVHNQADPLSLTEPSLWVSGYQAAFATGIIFAVVGLCAVLIFNREKKHSLKNKGILTQKAVK